MIFTRRVRTLWFLALSAAWGAWLCVLLLWLWPYVLVIDAVETAQLVMRCLGFLVVLTSAVACICSLSLLPLAVQARRSQAAAVLGKVPAANQVHGLFARIMTPLTLGLVWATSLVALLLSLVHGVHL